MSALERHEITELLRAGSSGDGAAREQLLPLVMLELRRLAGREAARWGRWKDARPTALVNEAYLRLFGRTNEPIDWPSRRYFFGAAARAMHDFMIEQHRRVEGSAPPSELPRESHVPGGEPAESIDLIDLRMLLDVLESIDVRAAEVFRLRSLLGMTIDEVSNMLEIGHATVERDYRYARVWLRKKLIEADREPSESRGRCSRHTAE